MGTRRIICLVELSSGVRLKRRTTEYSSSRWILRLMSVFKLETNNQTNNECLPKFVEKDNASSSIKRWPMSLAAVSWLMLCWAKGNTEMRLKTLFN